MKQEIPKVVFLTGPGELSKIMFNGIAKEFTVLKIILEKKKPARKIICNRIKRLGLLYVSGQICFVLFNKIYKRISIPGINLVKENYNLDSSNYPQELLVNVESVNEEQVVEILCSLNPDIVVVNGTRIISEKILSSIDAKFLNTHVGITPKYRGVHGGYWALTQKDTEHCGVTVHLVDKGIDTGGILYQDVITVAESDNFNTYPYHQIAVAIPLMIKSIKDVVNDTLIIKKNNIESKLWYHPTIFEYVKYRLLLGVK